MARPTHVYFVFPNPPAPNHVAQLVLREGGVVGWWRRNRTPGPWLSRELLRELADRVWPGAPLAP